MHTVTSSEVLRTQWSTSMGQVGAQAENRPRLLRCSEEYDSTRWQKCPDTPGLGDMQSI